MENKLIAYIDARIHALEILGKTASAEINLKYADIFDAIYIGAIDARRNELEQIKILIQSLSKC